MQDFRSLKVWEKAHDLTLGVYAVTSRFPSHEQFGLTSQLRRCVMSIPSNIAEGCGRGGTTEFARFLTIASGSANEAEYQLLLARDLNYLSQSECDQLQDQVNEVKRMLVALAKKVASAKTNN